MRRGIFALLVVVSFLPAGLQALSLTTVADSHANELSEFLIEQQVITNRELDAELTFWMTVKQAARRDTSMQEALELWRKNTASDVWTGVINATFYDFMEYSSPEFNYSLIEISPNTINKTVELKSDEEYAAIVIQTKVGKTKSLFLIVEGSYNEY